MTPTNFGDLSNMLSLPNGAVQVKRGVVDSYTNYTSATPAGTVFPDGSGGLMQISVIPSMPCYWLTTGAMLWWSAVAVWSRGGFGIRLSPTDLDGRGATGMGHTSIAVHSSVPWRYYNGSMMWRLAAGIAYTASLTWEYSAAQSQQFSTSPSWLQLHGLLLAEGVT
jgi:hypothetical protein